jgi:hypothetical protein
MGIFYLVLPTLGNQKDIYMHSHFFSLFLYALSAG